MTSKIRRALAIARLTLRSAVRSRLVLALVVALGAAIAGLPLIVKGDGTALGEMRVLLSYSLGISSVVLGIATLWASCSAVSLELDDRTLRLVAVKPITRGEIWFGKWAGLVVLNACLLVATGAGVYGSVWLRLRSTEQAKDAEKLRSELLVGRRRLRPVAGVSEEAVHERLEALIDAGQVPADAHEGEICDSLHRAMLTQSFTVAAGDSRTWTFQVPRSTRRALERLARSGASGASLRVRFVTGWRDENPTVCGWSIESTGGTEIYRTDVKMYPDSRNELELPASALAGLETFGLTLHNANAERQRALIVDPFSGLEILVRESRFAVNLARGIGVVLCQLALLAALGMACGTIFSLPVASFTAAALIVVTLVAHYFTFAAADVHAGCGHDHGPVAEPSLIRQASEHVLKGLGSIVRPVVSPDPLPRLSDGILVPPAMLAQSIALHALLLPAVLGLLSAFLFGRRELAATP